MRAFVAGMVTTLVLEGIAAVVIILNEVFLHGVKIIGDSYAEDTYLTVGVVEC